jgi:PAS domain S-box-containing protein
MKTIKRTHTFSIIAVIGAVLLVGGSGLVGLMSLNQTRLYTQRHIEHIDMARSAQIELEKQYNSWKSVVYESDKFESYQNNFLEYSKHLAKAQDCIFNLATVFQMNKNIYPRLNELFAYHNSINSQYVDVLSSIDAANKADREKAVASMKMTDKKVIDMMEGIVSEIKNNAETEITKINNVYFRIMLGSIIMLLLVTLAMGILIAYKNIRMHEILTAKVEKRTRELVDAHGKLSVSEEKYRLLIEGSPDIIFSMNLDLQFMRCNNAVKKFFRIPPDKLCGMNFLDLIYHDSDKDLERRMIKEQILGLIETGAPLNFNASFKSSANIEQKELRVHLSIMEADGKREIFGRIEDISEDTILKYQNYEHAVYQIDNFLLHADDVTSRISSSLIHSLPSGEVGVIRIALREMLINAIEHGNLGISFEEKTKAQTENRYYELIEERRADALYGNRKVMVEYIVDPKKVSYKITDEGCGFDVEKYEKNDPNDVNALCLTHGRGITMTRNVFDTVQYNKKGNQVLLIKNLLPVEIDL